MQAKEEDLAFEASSSSSSSSDEEGSKKSDIRIDLSQSQAVEPLIERPRKNMTSSFGSAKAKAALNSFHSVPQMMESYGSTYPNGSRSSGKTDDGYTLSQSSAGTRKLSTLRFSQ